MSRKLGDLTLEILLKVTEAEKGARQIAASLKNVDDVTKKVTQSTTDLTGKLGRVGFALNAVKEAGHILASSLSIVLNTIKTSNDAFQQYLSSSRQLEASSKLTGANLSDLNKISKQTESQFALTSGQSNLFTIELAKLGQKAGDVSKVQQSINALMDLGAGQGLDAEQTLYAIKQAILGIDEGTDKLFQKNPSVLYQEYADKIGTTAGKLTDQQKAQALLNSVLESGGKLTGSYSSYLDSAAGKQQILNAQLTTAKIKLGEQLQPALLSFLGHINNLLSFFNSLSPSTQKWIVILGTLSLTLGKLLPLIISFKDSFGGLSTSISNLGNNAPGSLAKFEKAGLSTFGKGGLLAGAILAFIGLIDGVLDKLDSVKKDRIKLKYYTPTPPPNVPPGYMIEGGVLVPDNSTPTMDWELFKKNSIEGQNEQKKLKEEIKDTNKEIENIGKSYRPGRLDMPYMPSEKELTEQEKYIEHLKQINKQINESLKFAHAIARSPANNLLPQINLWSISESVKGVKKEGPEDASSRYQQGFEESLSLAMQINDVLGLGADSFVSKFIGGLQRGISVAESILRIAALFGSGGITGLFSFLGFARGGSVPGSGSGDTVPALLTPGEFVINKFRASQLGTNFLSWLNGGMGGSSFGRYAAGGLVSPGLGGSVIINVTGELTDHLSYKIVDRGSQIRDIKIRKSKF